MNEPLDLLSQNRTLTARLEEAEAVFAAVRGGTVDALVVGAPGSQQIYTRKGADAPYRVFVEAMQEGAATVDAMGCVLYGNEALARLLGRPLRNLIGSLAREMAVPEHRDDFDALLRSGSSSGAQRAIELLSADGSSVPVLATAGALEAGGDQVALVVTDLREHERGAAARALLEQSERSRRALLSLLEDQKQTEEKLRASRDLLTSVVEHAPIRVFWKDRELRYLGCNGSFARDAGLSRPEELIGKDDFQMGWREQAELYRADDRAVIDSGTPKLGIEEPQTDPQGRLMWLRTSKVPLRDVGGKIVGVLGLYEDVTERKRAEQTLKGLNRALRTLSSCNEVLVRATDEAQLLAEMTRTVCEVGGYSIAVVGYALDDPAKSIDFKASLGIDIAQFGTVSWGDNALGQSVFGRTVRLGQRQLARNMRDDPAFAPRAAVPARAPVDAILAIPIRLEAQRRPMGVICFGASGDEVFDAEEVKLLEELAADLAYGIGNLRAREEQRKADQQIRVLARFPEENPNSVMRLDQAGVLLYANPASKAFLQACGARVGARVPDPCRTLATQALASDCVQQEDISLGGRMYAVTFAPVIEAGYVNLYGVDITARKHAEDTLHSALIATVEAIAATVETRDPYTAGHQRRVAELAAAIAREMGLPAKTVEGIHFGALVHDLGKMQVPAELLSKPTRLTKIEFELIKTHPQAGYEIVKDIKFPWPVADMVHQHHERLDGSGYPQGLKGDAIALEARILAVADVFEAMSSHRPYRPSLGFESALKEIQDKRGIWYEAVAVDACVRLFREKNFVLAKS